MSGLNKVTLIGNLGQDPEITHGSSGIAISKFSLATSDAKPDQAGNVKTEWHRIIVFGKTAEYVQNFIKKGATLCVEGRIQYGKYENKEGVTVYTTDIICNNLVNLTKRDNDQGGYQQQETQQNKQFNTSNEASDSNLPF